jgi:hypothetical protein
MKLSKRAAGLFCLVLPLSFFGCAGDNPKTSATPNQSASLAGQLPANPLQWKVITSMADHADSTMSTLYGNDVATGYARTNSQHDYPPGSVLSLVTWTEQEDPRWFGAMIPGTVKSVEFVTVGTSGNGPAYSYEKYEGTPLKKSSSQESASSNERAAYLVSQRAAALP